MQAQEYVVQRRAQFLSDAQRSLLEQGRYAEGLARSQELLAELRTRDPQHPDLGHLLYECAIFQQLSGKLEEAIATINETLAFDLANEGEVSWNTVRTLSCLAYWTILAGRHGQAEQFIRRGLAALQQLPANQQDERYVFLVNLAAIYCSRGELRNAELQTLEAARLVGRGSWWSFSFGNVCFELAWIYLRQGRLVAARRTIEKGIRICEKAERCRLDQFRLGSMYYQLGRVHQRLNEPRDARHSFAASLAVFENLTPVDDRRRMGWERLCRERLADLEESLVMLP
jgi:tetratricopeptide (TPR) repeat protein